MTDGVDRLLPEIIEWLKHDSAWPKGTWFENDEISLFLRQSWRILDRSNNTGYATIDFANIGVRCDQRRRGYFRRLLTAVERYAEPKAVYVENVHALFLVPHLLRRGYLFTLPKLDPPSLYRLPKPVFAEALEVRLARLEDAFEQRFGTL